MNETEPMYISILSDEDRSEYWKLRNFVSGPECRNCRNKRLDNFNEILSTIHKFCNKKKDDEWKRCQVCGICWFSDWLAINSRQFSYLLGKCKSSINGSFHRLKFMYFPCSAEASKDLIKFIPTLQTNPSELKQWSMRRQVVVTPQKIAGFDKNINSSNFKDKLEHENIKSDKIIKPKENVIKKIDKNIEQKSDTSEQNDHTGFFEDPFSAPADELFDSTESDCNDICF